MAVKFLGLFLLFATAFTVSMLLFDNTHSIWLTFMAFIYFVGAFVTMILTVATAMDDFLNK